MFYSLSFTGIQHLNGTSWKGSHLRVERAKESFLERLNRERAARQQEEDKTYTEKLNNNTQNTVPNVGEREYSEKEDVSKKQISKVNDSKHSNKRKNYNTHDDLSSKKNINLHSNDIVLQKNVHSDPPKRDKKKKKHEVEEKMLSSFKSFSSVWADSDNENDEEDVVKTGRDESHEEQQVSGGSAKTNRK